MFVIHAIILTTTFAKLALCFSLNCGVIGWTPENVLVTYQPIKACRLDGLHVNYSAAPRIEHDVCVLEENTEMKGKKKKRKKERKKEKGRSTNKNGLPNTASIILAVCAGRLPIREVK